MKTLLLAAATAIVLVGCGAPTTSPPSQPEAAATATAPTPTLAVAAPVAVAVPAIGAASTLIPTGITPSGELEVPDVDTPEQASWWDGSPEPGQVGPAVILGHVDGDGGRPGVFFRLRDLAPGDQVLVDRADGTRAVFVVDRVVQVPKAAFPTADVYGDTTRPELRLITCGGEFDRATGHYRDQVIAFAHLQEGP